MSLACRLATLNDAETIAHLHAESWRRTYRGLYRDAYLDGDVLADRLAVWRDRLGAPNPRQLVLVAPGDRGLAGFLCAYGNEDPRSGSLIDNLHVALHHQRSGTGTALMREAARWLGERHPAAGVYLGVMEANAGARRFYEKLGARDEGVTEKDSPGGGSARVCRYVWQSPAALLAACRADDSLYDGTPRWPFGLQASTLPDPQFPMP